MKLYSVQGAQEYWIADREQAMKSIGEMMERVATLFSADELTSSLLPAGLFQSQQRQIKLILISM